MNHRIIRFSFTDEAMSTIGDRREAETLDLPATFIDSLVSASMGYTARPLFESDPVAGLVRGAIAGIAGVTGADVSAEYRLARTQATAEHDGFGTLSGPIAAGWRTVAIAPDHYDWQESRYDSGLYSLEEVLPANE